MTISRAMLSSLAAPLLVVLGVAIVGASHVSAQTSSLPALRRSVCAGRAPCRIVERREAGTGPHGEALTVVVAALFSPAHPHADGSAALRGECAPFEYFLVTRWPHRPWTTQLLVRGCNDGYGASGIGEDDWSVSSRTFAFSRMGGSSWRWSTAETVRLAPLAIISSASTGGWNVGANRSQTSFQLAPLGGQGEWFAPLCSADGHQPEEHEYAIEGEPFDALIARWVAVPLMSVPSDVSAGGWRTSDLSACAAQIDGDQSGFALAGSPDASDALIRVIAASSRELFVDIVDAEHPASTAALHDRLWLHLGGERPSYMEHCVSAGDLMPVASLEIDLSQEAPLQTLAAAGEPIRVERAVLPDGVVRYRITLDRDLETFTLEYADTDDGVVEERRIATSAVRAGDPTSLGETGGLAGLSCQLIDGQLAPQIPARDASDEPVL